ncbi:MAG: KilA-N domain-containing protein [Lachnospiraceae bacterium]
MTNDILNRTTLEFLSTWEEMYTPDFKVFESEHFKKQEGLLTFTPSVSEWVEKTGAIGVFVKKGRYGGTFAHKDIAFEFASFGFTAKVWRDANPEFCVLI